MANQATTFAAQLRGSPRSPSCRQAAPDPHSTRCRELYGLFGLGRVYLQQRSKGEHFGGRAAWIRALKLTPRPAQAGWTAYRAKARRWPQLSHVEVEAQLAE
jgi:hypothetical protein